jgi:excisionase family DNA binding protein
MGEKKETYEQFIFGDLSGIDLSKCEEINIEMEDLNGSKNKGGRPPKQEQKTIYEKVIPLDVASKDEIFTVIQAAAYLQLRPETILRKLYAKLIRASKIGRIWRIKKSALDEYLERNVIEVEEDPDDI